MHQIPADKFGMIQSDDPVRVTRLPAAGRKGHFFVSDRQDTMIGNGNFMCISAKILDCVAKSVEGLFDIRTPVFFKKAAAEFRPLVRVPEFFTGRGKHQFLIFIKRIQFCKIFSFELIPEYPDRNKKRRSGFPYFMVFCQSAAGNDAVHMYMISEFLIPGMKNLDDPGCCAEPLFTGRKFKKCLGAASVQKGIEKPLVAVKQGIQFMRKRKDHMKVRGVDDFSSALVHPDFFVDGLTVRAVTVTAGIIVELQMATVLTLRNVDAKVTGFAAEDSTRSFPLDIGLVDA